MPKKQTIERARRDKREGKSASTPAGEFVREEIEDDFTGSDFSALQASPKEGGGSLISDALDFIASVVTTSKDDPREYIGEKHKHQQHKASGPGLAMPIVIRCDRISKDHHRQRCRRLVPARAPKPVTEAGK